MQGTKLTKVVLVGILVNLAPDEPQDPLDASALGLSQPRSRDCGGFGQGVMQLLADVHLRGTAMAGGLDACAWLAPPSQTGAGQRGEAAAAPGGDAAAAAVRGRHSGARGRGLGGGLGPRGPRAVLLAAAGAPTAAAAAAAVLKRALAAASSVYGRLLIGAFWARVCAVFEAAIVIATSFGDFWGVRGCTPHGVLWPSDRHTFFPADAVAAAATGAATLMRVRAGCLEPPEPLGSETG
eukprot:CAMPEP_0195076218 /NCGR_PEP_ID=MMETSP0448-20130528/18922_1 /TAXON_ID=66468 /ORGANISM="Heterocapsa triquestra, Strain CCMP 448" /LENGTH=237 /DNA_ID=CAMNT_0040108711 /DNA_START=394 /DNA_END=1106 /DNA_ORIENTATION=+